MTNWLKRRVIENGHEHGTDAARRHVLCWIHQALPLNQIFPKTASSSVESRLALALILGLSWWRAALELWTIVCTAETEIIGYCR